MHRLKIIILMLAAFAAGAGLNEYRHLALVPALAPEAGAGLAAIDDGAAVVDAPLSTAAQPGAVAATPVPEAFSWALVANLMARNQLSEAEHLLRTYLQRERKSAPAWHYLAQIYQQQARPALALEAWFHYVDLELDVAQRERALIHIKHYLTELYQRVDTRGQGADTGWLVAQLEQLINNTADDGALHLMLADLQLQAGDEYQAQYHALMAANDPGVQPQAEAILAKLSGGAQVTDEVSIPLAHFGDQYLVAVTIDGNSAKLLLDTGASISGVSERFIARFPALVRTTKPIQLNTASGTVDSYLFNVDNLAMGSLNFQRHLLARLPMGDANHFDGLLGVDILGRYDFVIDRDAMLLRLKPRAR